MRRAVFVSDDQALLELQVHARQASSADHLSSSGTKLEEEATTELRPNGRR
jgi:hypothetical protein